MFGGTIRSGERPKAGSASRLARKRPPRQLSALAGMRPAPRHWLPAAHRCRVRPETDGPRMVGRELAILEHNSRPAHTSLSKFLSRFGISVELAVGCATSVAINCAGLYVTEAADFILFGGLYYCGTPLDKKALKEWISAQCD